MKVTLHKSTDGVLHESAKECAKRNIELRVRAAAENVVFNTGTFEVTSDTESGLREEDIAAFIAANQEVLRKILAESLIVRRPRKPKLQAVKAVAA